MITLQLYIMNYWPMLDALHRMLHPLVGGC